MEDSNGRTPLKAPKSDTSRTLPPAMSNESTDNLEGVNRSFGNDNRLQQSISVGKKGETKSVDARNIESLRPSDDAITSDQD